MFETKNKPWLIDGRDGSVVSYETLLEVLSRRPFSFRSLCQPASTQDALREIAASLVYGFELTLFDTNFAERELAALGFSKTQLNRLGEIVDQKTICLADLQAAAGGASSAILGLFTSGSSGLPKLVRQSVSNLARAVKIAPRHSGAVWAFTYNPTHVAGMQVYLQALANGCPIVDVYGLERSKAIEAIERHGVTHISATPSFYRLLLPAERPLPEVRSVTLGGESSDAALLARLRPFFPSARFHNIYASTEAGTLLTADGDVFSVASGLGSLVVVREGRIHVHRSLLGAFAGGEAKGEWYDTGDEVEVVDTLPLKFRIVARERDWVNVGGSKVNPREVEGVLEEFPGVRKVRVCGRANSVMGQILYAEIECIGAVPAESSLREFAAARLQPFKVPRLIRFVDKIEQTRTGKVSRQ